MINSKNLLKYKPTIGFKVSKASLKKKNSHSPFSKVYLKIVLTCVLLTLPRTLRKVLGSIKQ